MDADADASVSIFGSFPEDIVRHIFEVVIHDDFSFATVLVSLSRTIQGW
jgi:hypothetical protein